MAVRFFAWLLVQGRIQCKANLVTKGIVDAPTCELCKLGCPNTGPPDISLWRRSAALDGD